MEKTTKIKLSKQQKFISKEQQEKIRNFFNTSKATTTTTTKAVSKNPNWYASNTG